MRIADERHQRRAGVERLDEPGHQVGGAGPQGCIDQTDAARHLGVGVGGEHAAALVVDEVVVETEAAGGVIEGQQLEPAHAEHRPGIEGLEAARHRLATRHLVRLRHVELNVLVAAAADDGSRSLACQRNDGSALGRCLMPIHGAA